jgi:hypothetical protein
MRIQTDILRRTRQPLVLSVRDMHLGRWIVILFRQAEIDDIDLVPPFPDAHEEIVGLDVPVEDVAGVNVLGARDELVCE